VLRKVSLHTQAQQNFIEYLINVAKIYQGVAEIQNKERASRKLSKSVVGSTMFAMTSDYTKSSKPS
jgi:hypothetical protein